MTKEGIFAATTENNNWKMDETRDSVEYIVARMYWNV